ncbi:hypothetical protein GCWU000246_01805 [Jonquetella anthropi E3_33 E1]|nr:hypothetical protein GCWU000246_01805 [Jonquetella anthropi E3_33 E1]
MTIQNIKPFQRAAVMEQIGQYVCQVVFIQQLLNLIVTCRLVQEE